MTALANQLKTNVTLLVSTIVESNPAAVAAKLNGLGYPVSGDDISQLKTVIDSLINSGDLQSAQIALSVPYIFGVLPVQYDQAILELQTQYPQKRGTQSNGWDWNQFVSDVLGVVGQIFGNGNNGNNPPAQPPPPAPMNWKPILTALGIFAGAAIIITLLVVFGRKKN